ncbi:MAG TPA: hypothetical protein VGC61_07585, partial [Pyrinomonadaceae bacterium]
MLKTFNCPKCGAPVSYDKDVIGANLTARCSYCNSSLSVPDEMRGRPAQIITPINIDLRNTGASITKIIVIILLIPVIGLIIGAIAMGGFLIPMLTGKPAVKSDPPPLPRIAPVVPGKKEKPPNAFANEVLKFGSEGIGPGMFKDARAIALDGSGKIYVGEYIGGRVQVFDPSGQFITQWMVDRKMPLRGLAADRNGNVFVAQKGVISKYEGGTGNLLGQLDYAEGWGFDYLTATADGGLVAAWYKNRDDIVRFDSNGK